MSVFQGIISKTHLIKTLSISAQRCCSTENMGSTKALNYNPNVNPGDEKWHERQSLPGSSYFKFRWPTYNDRIYKPDGTYRPAFVCHMRPLVKYSPDKMFYVAGFVRGLTVDEAIKQLSFVQLKGAVIVKEVLQEAREMALNEHGFEFATNMWVAESFTNQLMIVKGFRRHARMRFGVVRYKYIAYCCRLEEGSPPKVIYDHKQAHWSGHDFLQDYIRRHREKTVPQY